MLIPEDKELPPDYVQECWGPKGSRASPLGATT